MLAPLKATFFAFRARERGGVLARATAVHVVLCLALFAAFAVLLFVIPTADRLDTSASGAAVPSLLSVLLAIFLYCVVTASYEAACLRWMIRGETAGFAGFSLGADTWRVYSGYWIWFLIGMAAYVPIMLIVGIAGRAAVTAQDPIAQVMPLYLGWAVWALLIFPVALRFAPGNAVSVARRKFSYFAAWRASRGRFWALFGSFITLWIIWLFVYVAFMFGSSLALVGLGGDGGAAFMPAATLLCLFIANFALAFLSAGVNARAVGAAIAEGRLDGATEDVAEVFA